MNDKFYELIEEKQLAIINAGFEVFGSNEYKRASTDEIAAKAGISKGLLFYYFHDKLTFYMFLYEYAEEFLRTNIVDDSLCEVTDFFELLLQVTISKYKLLRKNPYLLEFIIRTLYTKEEKLVKLVKEQNKNFPVNSFNEYFNKIDFTKFKEEINPQEILQMLNWLLAGYLYEKSSSDLPIQFSEIMNQYKIWSDILKTASYKEEHQ
ncbi:MAG: TetR/AcrR family transcriptional regulator [Anaerocolumna sp.]